MKIKLIMRISIALLFLLNTNSAIALSHDELSRKTLALDYLQAYVNRDYLLLSHYYSESTLFRDISEGKKFSGTRKILNFLQESTQGITAYRFIPDQIYIGSSSVSLIGSYEIETEGTLYGKPGKNLFLTVPGITVLVISNKDSLIKEHIDILDYTSLQGQLDTYK